MRRALQANGLDGQFFVRREPGGKIVVDQVRFLSATRITYDPTTRRLTAMRGGFSWRTLLMRVHTRGEYDTNGSLQIPWGVIVDAIQVAIIVWIASGLYMWWRLGRFRGWALWRWRPDSQYSQHSCGVYNFVPLSAPCTAVFIMFSASFCVASFNASILARIT